MTARSSSIAPRSPSSPTSSPTTSTSTAASRSCRPPTTPSSGPMRPGGLLVTCADDAGAVGLAERAGGDGLRVLTYGFDPALGPRSCATTRQDGLTSAATLVRRRRRAPTCRSASRAVTTPSTRRPRMPPLSTALARTPPGCLRASRRSRARGDGSSPRARRAASSSSTTTPTTPARSRRSSRRRSGSSSRPDASSWSSSRTSTAVPGLRDRAGAGLGTGRRRRRHGRLCRAGGPDAGRLRPARRRCRRRRPARRGGSLRCRRGRRSPGVVAGLVAARRPRAHRRRRRRDDDRARRCCGSSAVGHREAERDPLASAPGSPLPEADSSVEPRGRGVGLG